MVKHNLVQDLFWRLNPPVRQSVWRTLLSGQCDPCGLSHSHFCSGTKGRGSNLFGWHLLQAFPAHASSTWRITRQQGLPRYHHLKEYGEGATRVGGLNVWQMRRQGVFCALLTARKKIVFSTQKLCATPNVLYRDYMLLLRRLNNGGSVKFFQCDKIIKISFNMNHSCFNRKIFLIQLGFRRVRDNFFQVIYFPTSSSLFRILTLTTESFKFVWFSIYSNICFSEFILFSLLSSHG